ncbi:AAA family ATPase [Stagnimonas aquatica]|uniref:AAA family ATPase n=1 Tax=Stagnimonas aquatica TaxID=2689987 RepID=A0A3N0V557_9GAMM|nr:ExeA family protein [Stagnimonas aquatica]ROH87805.1 AAA family ATPase [Stagnimonas aquatica]
MYTSFFNLREVPFSIAPDPAYLYMSPRHQEALGHLLYGTGQYGGFVQLTGEVGTGKTTIIRTLLAQKLQNVDVAMIHNPRQSEQEFVQSICDELGVRYGERPSLKTLVDALNAYLLEQHAGGRRTVLIIDEAQQLAPEVLEQVRLLTNLETTKEKLLRIMLIGQPELAELLARQDLRQLAQRITARYHLTPLDALETGEYIAHRLQIAGGARDLFSPAAMKAVHKHAGGVPRLVNVICDRALLGAYSQGLRQVTPEIVHKAAEEALGKPVAPPRRQRDWRLPRLPRLPRPSLRSLEIGLAAVGLLVAGLLLRQYWPSPTPGVEPAPEVAAEAGAVPAAEPPVVVTAPAPAPETPPSVSQPTAISPAPASLPVAAPVTKPKPAAAAGVLERVQAASAPLSSLMPRLGKLWDKEFRVGNEKACRALHRYRLECLKGNGEWSDLSAMNAPAVLTLSVGGELRYVLLRELSSERAVLLGSQGSGSFALSELDPLWTGEYLLLWKRETDEISIGPEIRGEPIQWLRQRLAERLKRSLGDPLDGRWDAELREAVQSFQTIHGIRPDGIAGARTLQALSDRRGSPQLRTRP